MGAILGVLIGSLLAAFGFVAMRNPMRLNLFSFYAGAEGYYQRMVLDTSTRNQLRVLGALICLFGSSIFSASAGAELKVHFLSAISEGLWVLYGLHIHLCLGRRISSLRLAAFQRSGFQLVSGVEARFTAWPHRCFSAYHAQDAARGTNLHGGAPDTRLHLFGGFPFAIVVVKSPYHSLSGVASLTCHAMLLPPGKSV